MNDITNFIQAMVNDKPVQAQDHFNSIMNQKISNALETKQTEIVNNIFNNKDDDDVWIT